MQATKSSHDIAIYIDGTRKLDCRESLDYVRSDPSNPYMFSKGKTCSVSGVFFLQRSSDLSIRILTSQTAVILKPENTNFGAILLKTWNKNFVGKIKHNLFIVVSIAYKIAYEIKLEKQFFWNILNKLSARCT